MFKIKSQENFAQIGINGVLLNVGEKLHLGHASDSVKGLKRTEALAFETNFAFWGYCLGEVI